MVRQKHARLWPYHKGSCIHLRVGILEIMSSKGGVRGSRIRTAIHLGIVTGWVGSGQLGNRGEVFYVDIGIGREGEGWQWFGCLQGVKDKMVGSI